MKNRRKLYSRTETFEQILIRSKTAKSNFRKNSGETIDLPQGNAMYRVEIYQVDSDGKRMIFKCKLSGSIEIVETDENF